MLGFKSFWSTRIIIVGIETMHMIRKGQMDCPAGNPCPQRSSSTASLFDHQVSDATLFGQTPLLRQNPGASLRVKNMGFHFSAGHVCIA